MACHNLSVDFRRIRVVGGSVRIVVLGVGYVGLVSGACLSELGHTVVCVDRDRSKIATLLEGHLPIFEPELADVLNANRAAGRLSFGADLRDALSTPTDVVVIAVGTPARKRDGEADLTSVYEAAKQIASCATNSLVVATKSTVPVRTGDTLQKLFQKLRPELEILAVSNPEFLREGSAVRDFLKPDRIVVGANSRSALARMYELYRPLTTAGVKLFPTDLRTAELIKYASNAFLAVKVSFANELADLCEQVGTNIQDVSLGMGLDCRIGPAFLRAGPGFGGSCFPKDTLALLRTAQDHGVALRLVEETVTINNARKRKMSRKVIDALDGDVDGRVIAVLGLAFKGNTDDVRESPSFPLIEGLQREGARIKAYDPKAMSNAAAELSDVELCRNAMECVEGADAVVIATDWLEFAKLDLKAVAGAMKSNVVIDLRNSIDPDAAQRAGLVYVSIGRPAVGPSTSLGDGADQVGYGLAFQNSLSGQFGGGI